MGYTKQGTSGFGTGKGFAKIMAASMWDAVKAGLVQISHFEEVALLSVGIGADRISDSVAYIIRKRLAEFTIDVCNNLNIQLYTFPYSKGIYSIQENRWKFSSYSLPYNPFSKKPVLLVPKKYLRELPTINSDDFWDYCFHNENESLRNQFGFDIKRKVSKKTIIQFAKSNPLLRKKYLVIKEGVKGVPYNLDKDPIGLAGLEKAKKYVADFPKNFIINSNNDLLNAIHLMNEEFKQFIEKKGGWNLLWNDDNTPRRESASQYAYLGIVQHYCIANDIDITREANVGSGCVDFKMSIGHSIKIFLEVKKVSNSRFWNGLKKQLPAYMDSEQIKLGCFIVIVYTDKDLKKIIAINNVISQIQTEKNISISLLVVEARKKKTASTY